MLKNFQGSILLLIAAIIWGTAFVAQSEGMRYVEPFTYTALRMIIGGIVLIPIIILTRKLNSDRNFKETIKGGICCGFVLFIASSLQQIGITTTTAGKAGFVTALYIVIVPLIELLVFRKKISKSIWLCVFLAIIGFYFLCITDDFGISKGDLLILLCAFCFSWQIITVDHFITKNTNGVLMSCVQFLTAGILSLFGMFIFETPKIGMIIEARGTILYTGILSCSVAYTLQIIGQQRTKPTIATLIMSLEAVFALLSGWLILNETLSLKEFTGCVIVLFAVIFAQLKSKNS